MSPFTAPTVAVPHGFFGAEADDCSLAKADPAALANLDEAAFLVKAARARIVDEYA